MGNCSYGWKPSVYRILSTTKSGKGIDSPSQSGENDIVLPSNPQEVEELLRKTSANPLIAYTFKEMEIITGNFAQDRVLGKGGFGMVYKGYISGNLKKGIQVMNVAVKVHQGDSSFQGHREWLAEVIFLGQLSHPNLVKLVGYCCENDHRMLIYEFMAGGTVEKCLFSGEVPLSWSNRMKIAYAAAKGLAFLHEAKVIYRDFKTSNILLDMDYNAKLSDFGLAKDGPAGDQSHVSTRVMGTYGYAAPEYVRTGHLNASSDVYSYGIVLLELITGRKSLDRRRAPEEQDLAAWALPLINQRRRKLWCEIVDPRLGGIYESHAVHKAAILSAHCLDENPKARPFMRDIVQTLEPLQPTSHDPVSNYQREFLLG